MKTIRLGNDVQINWYITRFGSPEDFTGKNLKVKLIDKLGTEQVFDYEIQGNRITGIFYGKDQSTNGVYRLLLVENDGEEDMVSLDYIDAFCLSNKMKNQTSNGSDTTSTINTEVEEYESKIDLEQDLFLYAKKTYVNGKINEVNNRIDNDFYKKQEIDYNIYTKDQVDQIISEIPIVDTYTKSEVDSKIYDVSSGIPTKTSELTNDSGYATEEWVENKHYLVASDIAGKADASNVYNKTQVDNKLALKADKLDIPTKTSDLTNDSGYVSGNDLADVAKSGSYNDLTNKPVIPSLDGYATEAWVENKHYLVAADISGKADSSTVYTKVQVDSKLDGKADKSDIPSKTSDLTNDSGFIDTTALSTLFDDAEYDSSTKRINFKHGSNILAYVDATDFIKDGMVESVVIENGYVVITFNTDSGKEAIKIDITDIFNPENYYDKTAINGLLEGKQNVILDLNQIRLDASAGAIAYGWGNHANAGYAKDADLANVAKSGSYNDLSDKPTIPSLDGYATEQWVEDKHYLVANDVSTFVDSSTVYTKEQVDNKLVLKADKSEIPSKTSDLNNDSNFITTAVADQNFEAKAWRGTQAEYDALTVIEQNKIYIILPTS